MTGKMEDLYGPNEIHCCLFLVEFRQNLKNLKTARCLNTRQARWALFFTRITDLALTSGYHPWVNGRVLRIIQDLTMTGCVSSPGKNTTKKLWGYQPLIPAVDEWFKNEQVLEKAHHRISVTSASHKICADRRRGETPTYRFGNRVWLSTHNLTDW